jgi:hypothetical protein
LVYRYDVLDKWNYGVNGYPKPPDKFDDNFDSFCTDGCDFYIKRYEELEQFYNALYNLDELYNGSVASLNEYHDLINDPEFDDIYTNINEAAEFKVVPKSPVVCYSADTTEPNKELIKEVEAYIAAIDDFLDKKNMEISDNGELCKIVADAKWNKTCVQTKTSSRLIFNEANPYSHKEANPYSHKSSVVPIHVFKDVDRSRDLVAPSNAVKTETMSAYNSMITTSKTDTYLKQLIHGSYLNFNEVNNYFMFIML